MRRIVDDVSSNGLSHDPDPVGHLLFPFVEAILVQHVSREEGGVSSLESDGGVGRKQVL